VYNYDALGRTVGVVAPDGSSTTTYLYEGNTVKTTDASGKWKKFTQDAVGNLTQVNEPNPAGGADYVTSYTYDKFDRLYQVSMPRLTGTQTRTFNYGSNGQLSSKIEPETGTTTMFYNSDGTVDYKLDAKGQKVQMAYDASKRVSVIKKYPDGVNEDACQRVEMFYDGTYPADGDAGVTLNANGRLSAVRYKGARCTLLNGHTYVEQYSYLNYGAMTKKRLKVIRNLSSGTASGVLESVAEYDGEGRLLATTYPVTGKRYQYGFDSRGLPSSLTNTTDSTTLVSSVVYGVAGEMTTFVHGGGTETRSYNDNGQMTTLNLPGRTISYTFPSPGANNGKVASITDSGETIAYVYDSLQRLTSATGSGWSQGYQYDGFGNMYNKTATGGAPTWSASIDPATNRISTLSYDANGNQTFITTTTGIPDSFNLSYDVSNRLTLAVNAGPSIRSDYGYDAGNKRIWEKRTITGGASGEWFYFFGITGQRLARYNFTVAGAAITFTQDNASVWFGMKLVQKVNSLMLSWPGEDRLSSVGKYLPYGEDKPGATNPPNDSEKFASYTRDAGTGLDYAAQRFHHQGNARFLTSDPYQASAGTAQPGSWNRYSYVGGDPINKYDPRGLEDETPPLPFCYPWCNLVDNLRNNWLIDKIGYDANIWKASGTPEDQSEYASEATSLQFRSEVIAAIEKLPVACKELFAQTKFLDGSSLADRLMHGTNSLRVVQVDSAAQWNLRMGSQWIGSSLYSELTVRQYVDQRYGHAIPDAWYLRGASALFVSQTFYSLSSNERGETAFHEMLHLTFDRAGVAADHDDLADLWGFSLGNGDPAQAVNDWIWRKNCAKP
jgi:RHS repeat-associated protein